MKTFRFFFLAAAALATAVIGAPGCSSDDSGSGNNPTDGGPDVKADVKKDVTPILCEAHQISDYSAPTNLHKTVKQTACGDGDSEAFFDACLGDAATQDTCSAFQTAHADCAACLVTQNTASANWGALYVMNNQLYINVVGCVAVAGGEAGVTCEKDSQIWEDCAGKVCSEEWCPDTTDPTYQTCLDDAANGTCKTWAEPYNTCITDAQSNAATAFCFKAGGSSGTTDALLQIMRTICGGAPRSDAGTTTDSGATDN